MKKIKLSIVSPTYNEAENIEELYLRISAVIAAQKKYDFEIIFIDNASTDGTVDKIRAIADTDKSVKAIVNTRNFGHIRSPYWGILQSKGEATIYLASDLQDPPELILDFIREWENGFKIVLATKPVSCESKLTFYLRKLYYRLLNSISEVDIAANSTGFGLYDKKVIDSLRNIADPYPFLRGLICELGFKIKTVDFNQPRRARGISKNNFYSLYDIAMLGFISSSMIPIRMASFVGLLIGGCSILFGALLLAAKLMFWDVIPIGYAPFGIITSLIAGLLFVFIGILGEYVGSIYNYVSRRPIVVENYRINYEE